MSEDTPSDRVYATAPMPWSEPYDDTMTDVVHAIAGLSKAEQRSAWDELARQFEQRASFDSQATAVHRDERAAARLAVKTLAAPVVYYMRFGDRVKIGYTRNLPERLKGIPHDELLGTEPGGRDVEAARHRQFASDHVKGEWFHLTPTLEAHIASLV